MANENKQYLLEELDREIFSPKKMIVMSEDVQLFNGADFLLKANYLLHINKQSKKQPITYVVSSFGGDVYGLLSIIDAINMLPCKVDTIGLGANMSAAAFILAAGTGTRYISKHTQFMIHEISSFVNGSTKDINAEAGQVNYLQELLYKLLEQYSKKDKKFWKDIIKTQLYLTSEKCLEYGLVDKIL